MNQTDVVVSLLLADLAEELSSTQVVNRLLEFAMRTNASDIHIEPTAKDITLRYRIDGQLRMAKPLSKKLQASLIAHLKLLAHLKVDEQQLPQTGRLRATLGDTNWQLRISTLPTLHGEKLSVHLLKDTAHLPSLEKLGLWGTALHTLQQAALTSKGLVVIAGPGGSGKSTTLASLLSQLDARRSSIASLEDPIEYELPGINQTQVNHRANAAPATSLRAVLAQNPDVVLVSTIDEPAMVDQVMQAAAVNQLIFTSMVAARASAGVYRLLSLGAEPHLLAANLRAISVQHLVRKLCVHCRVRYQPTTQLLTDLKKRFNLSTTDFKRLHQLEQQARQAGFGQPNDNLASTDKTITTLWRAKKGGCAHCHQSGYSGRTGLFEVLEPNTLLQTTLLNKPSAEDIQTVVGGSKTISIEFDGLTKALCGETSLGEVVRTLY